MNSKIIAITLLAATVVTAHACTPSATEGGPVRVSNNSDRPAADQTKAADNRDFNPKDFQANVAAQKGLILDVRTQQEFASGHIDGALNIDWYSPQFKAEIAKLDKSKPIFVYCAVGGRSGQAKKVLSNEGFKEVHNLNGGIEAWKNEGLKVVK